MPSPKVTPPENVPSPAVTDPVPTFKLVPVNAPLELTCPTFILLSPALATSLFAVSAVVASALTVSAATTI